jgi:hypothetical protein
LGFPIPNLPVVDIGSPVRAIKKAACNAEISRKMFRRTVFVFGTSG